MASLLGGLPQLNNNIESRLINARMLAISCKKKTAEEVYDLKKKEFFNLWQKKYSNVINTVLAISLSIMVIPISFSIYDKQGTQDKYEKIQYVMTENDYLDNVYHIEADHLDENYLIEVGLIK